MNFSTEEVNLLTQSTRLRHSRVLSND